ncbi:hypothetical protein L7F22_068052 [Adiantum nelumboides]|nr:hypothetical protein [Adiantum nelumboides]
MRQPSSRDDRSKKESYHKDDRSKKESYHKDKLSKNRSKKDSYHRDDRSKKESYHKDDRSSSKKYPSKEARGDLQRRYELLRKDRHEHKYQRSLRSGDRSRRAERSHDKDDRKKDRYSNKHRSTAKVHKRISELRKDKTRENVPKRNPRSFRSKSEEETLVRNAEEKLKSSEAELKRLNKEYDQYNITRDRAREAKIPPGNTKHEAWAEKYIEMETAKSNIRRHERVGNLLQHVPALQQALHGQADRLKAKPDRLEEEMAKLKSVGKHDWFLEYNDTFKENRINWEHHKQVKKHEDENF